MTAERENGVRTTSESSRTPTPGAVREGDAASLSDEDGSPWVVLALRKSPNGPMVAEAVAIRAEWEAHDVAMAFVRLGHRTFFIDPDSSSIEEYQEDTE